MALSTFETFFVIVGLAKSQAFAKNDLKILLTLSNETIFKYLEATGTFLPIVLYVAILTEIRAVFASIDLENKKLSLTRGLGNQNQIPIPIHKF